MMGHSWRDSPTRLLRFRLERCLIDDYVELEMYSTDYYIIRCRPLHDTSHNLGAARFELRRRRPILSEDVIVKSWRCSSDTLRRRAINQIITHVDSMFSYEGTLFEGVA